MLKLANHRPKGGNEGRSVGGRSCSSLSSHGLMKDDQSVAGTLLTLYPDAVVDVHPTIDSNNFCSQRQHGGRQLSSSSSSSSHGFMIEEQSVTGTLLSLDPTVDIVVDMTAQPSPNIRTQRGTTPSSPCQQPPKRRYSDIDLSGAPTTNHDFEEQSIAGTLLSLNPDNDLPTYRFIPRRSSLPDESPTLPKFSRPGTRSSRGPDHDLATTNRPPPLSPRPVSNRPEPPPRYSNDQSVPGAQGSQQSAPSTRLPHAQKPQAPPRHSVEGETHSLEPPAQTNHRSWMDDVDLELSSVRMDEDGVESFTFTPVIDKKDGKPVEKSTDGKLAHNRHQDTWTWLCQAIHSLYTWIASELSQRFHRSSKNLPNREDNHLKTGGTGVTMDATSEYDEEEGPLDIATRSRNIYSPSTDISNESQSGGKAVDTVSFSFIS